MGNANSGMIIAKNAMPLREISDTMPFVRLSTDIEIAACYFSASHAVLASSMRLAKSISATPPQKRHDTAKGACRSDERRDKPFAPPSDACYRLVGDGLASTGA